MIKKHFAILAMLLSFSLFSQKYPFPQNITYKYGYKSQHITSDDVNKEYNLWKATYVRPCTRDDEAKVVSKYGTEEKAISEGIGYGMLITAYIGDQELFNKLLNYHIRRRNIHGVMNWMYLGEETGDNKKNGATDADLDAAMALIVASKQWAKDKKYSAEAIKLIDSIQKFCFTECSGILVQKPGDFFGGCNCTNPSYYAPAYYRAFAKFREETGNIKAVYFWNKAAEEAYIPLMKNAHPQTGLIYAWTNSEGTNPLECNYEVQGSGTFSTYQYDACRAPWRICNDYIWWGNANAANWLKQITNFINTTIINQSDIKNSWYGAGGIENIVDGYFHNGKRKYSDSNGTSGEYHTIPFTGSFALAAMATSQESTDLFMAHFKNMEGDSYYSSCLAVLYKLMASGNFWNPYDMKK